MNQSSGSAGWTILEEGDWQMMLAASDTGLLFVGGLNETIDAALRRFDRVYPGCGLMQDDRLLAPYAEQLRDYIRGERRALNVPLDLDAAASGTPFRHAVWEGLRAIPYGETITYAELARRIGKPAAARAVGAAVGANPLLIAVPCHRVVGSDGSLTGYRGGLDMKRMLLELERRNLAAGRADNPPSERQH